MAYAIGEVITLGIGTPSEIAPFILFGLAPEAAPPTPGGSLTVIGDFDDLCNIFNHLQGGTISYSRQDIQNLSIYNNPPNTPISEAYSLGANTTFMIHKISWSYSDTPTNGNLTITGGEAQFNIDIISSGVGSFMLGPYRGFEGVSITVALSAGGPGVVGKMDVDITNQVYLLGPV